MNPSFRATVAFTVIAAVQVAAYDKNVDTPPVGPVAAMLNATASVSAVSYIQPDAMGLEKTYDTTMGREKTASALSFIMLKSRTGSGQLSFVA